MGNPSYARWGAKEDAKLEQYFDDLIESGEKWVPLDNHSIRIAWKDVDPNRSRNSFFSCYKRRAEIYNDILKKRIENDSK